MIIAIIILTIACVTLLLIVWNLLTKLEKYEEDILLKDEFIDKFKTTIEEAHKKIEALDIKGAFESDDEVGFFFKDLKSISLALNAYYQNYLKKEDTGTQK